MNLSRKRFVFALTALGATGCARTADDRVKVGFIVKQPEEPWFQDEWRFAGKAADQYGFELMRIGATDGERVLSAIHNLAASGARGFVICAPDTRLGPAILQNARANDLKVMSVDDRLLGADGKPIEEIPHVGISAQAIGRQVGETIAAEARSRNWPLADIGLLRIAFDSLQTARERTTGARDALIAAGLPAGRVFDAPQRTSDTEGGFNAAGPVLTRQSAIRRWAVVGMNDETVVGGVRAAEGLGVDAGDAIAVGINGGATAQAEFVKPDRTAFFATILLSARRHGFDTAEAMYRWIANGVQPQPLVLTSGIVMNRENWRRLKAEQEA